MNRPILVSAFLLMSTAALGAQQASPYEGTSNPPPDDTIVTSGRAQAKPPANDAILVFISIAAIIAASGWTALTA